MTTESKPAGLRLRLVAQAVDFFIYCLCWIVLPLLVNMLLGRLHSPPNIYLDLALHSAALMFLGIYYVGFLTSRWQATPGKRLVGVYVARLEDGGRISTACALGRSFLAQFPYVGLSALNLFFDITDMLGITDPLSASNNVMGSLMLFGILLAGSAYYLLLSLTILFSHDRRGAHDRLCKTQVFKGRPV